MTPDERRDRSLPPRAKELRGMIFGDLTVVGLGPKDKFGNVRWICWCKCGQSTEVRASNLLAGHTNSCGCRRKTAQAKLWSQARP